MPSLAARALAAIALFLAPVGAWAYKREKLVVVVDQRAAGSAAGDLGPVVSGILGSKGYEVLAGRDVEQFVRAQGIQELETIPAHRIATLLQQFRADALLHVKVTFYLPETDRSVGPRANAAIGVAAERRGGNGKVNWRSTASARGDDVIEYLGRDAEPGTPQTLVSVASERVLWSLPRAPEDPALVALREEQKRRAALAPPPPPMARRMPDPQRLDALLKKSPSFRTGPRFRLRLNKTQPNALPAAPAPKPVPAAPKPVPVPANPVPVPVP